MPRHPDGRHVHAHGRPLPDTPHHLHGHRLPACDAPSRTAPPTARRVAALTGRRFLGQRARHSTRQTARPHLRGARGRRARQQQGHRQVPAADPDDRHRGDHPPAQRPGRRRTRRRRGHRRQSDRPGRPGRPGRPAGGRCRGRRCGQGAPPPAPRPALPPRARGRGAWGTSRTPGPGARVPFEDSGGVITMDTGPGSPAGARRPTPSTVLLGCALTVGLLLVGRELTPSARPGPRPPRPSPPPHRPPRRPRSFGRSRGRPTDRSAGHVDTRTGPAVFFRLGALTKGRTVEVERADGRTAVFTVDAVEVYEVVPRHEGLRQHLRPARAPADHVRRLHQAHRPPRQRRRPRHPHRRRGVTPDRPGSAPLSPAETVGGAGSTCARVGAGRPGPGARSWLGHRPPASGAVTDTTGPPGVPPPVEGQTTEARNGSVGRIAASSKSSSSASWPWARRNPISAAVTGRAHRMRACPRGSGQCSRPGPCR